MPERPDHAGPVDPAASISESGMPSTKFRASRTVKGTCSAATGRMTAQSVL